ncbi:mucin-5AC isoform X2 [Kryptolebias marmoratus]|uniref:mucin-5AC isoform X2 n=1 Tax=Kryptolebias marmoratus TaxID=37003 RepID=UPI0018ACDCA2|nr:mucin-5AC isoform X2 [Kryptolebias marmoratus]
MFLKHLHLALLFGAVAKAETATSGNVSLTNSPTSHMPTTSSSNISTSTLTTTGVITTESTTRATMTVTPTNPAGETTTRNPTHPPSAPTTGAAASPTTPEANRPASSETTKTTTAPASSSNTTTSAPVTTSTPPINTSTTTAPINTSATTAPINISATTAPINISATTAPINISATTAPINTSATTAVNSTDTSEAPASTATPSSSTINTNTTLPTGLPPSPPSSSSTSSSLPPITSPGSSTIPPTGVTTSLSPSAPTPGVTSHATGTITTTDTSPDSTTLTPNPATATADRDATTVVTEGSASTAAPPTLGPAIECPSVPCPTQSVCLGGACQCLSGSYMKNKRCEPAQVFPGRLHFSSLTFDERMSDRSSDVFRRTAAQISAALQKVLGNEEGYIRSDVVQLQSGSVLATVNNIFEDSPATQESVDRLITAATIASSGFLNNASYEGANLCEVEPLPCDASTTTCTSVTGRAACSCRDGYVSTVYVSTSCKACPSGQRAVGDACQQCPFGYAGFNCSDSALLAVVVISCVLGGALLVVVLAVLVYYAWRRCSCRMPSYSTSPYSDDLNKSWPVSVMPIPRASTNWDAATSIELTEGGNVNVLEEKRHQSNGSGSQLKHKGWKKSGSYDLDPENMQTFKGKNSSRYSYLVQGHENPYFLPGDEKRN